MQLDQQSPAVHDNGHGHHQSICRDRSALREDRDDVVADMSHRTHKTIIVARQTCREH